MDSKIWHHCEIRQAKKKQTRALEPLIRPSGTFSQRAEEGSAA
jgi:hypothetical protein